MIDIFSDLKETGYKVWQQGSAPKTIPDKFITVWNTSSVDKIVADNKVRSIEYSFNVIFYTKSYDNIYSDMEKIIRLLKSKNYEIDGYGFDAPSGMEDYIARGVEALKIEKLGG